MNTLKIIIILAVGAISLPFSATAKSTYERYPFTTLAGNPPGTTDGPGSAARFNLPEAVAVDASGNIYVADTANSTIRMISPAGVVSTLAGSSGSTGASDGSGSDARFDNPAGIAVDSAGNIYVSDTLNETIRKITPAGAVTTLAGSAGNDGSADGNGAAARFYSPRGLAVDGGGNIYVADSDNNLIRKVTPAGNVTTVAGMVGQFGSADGVGSAARFAFPEDVAVDSARNLYVSDTFNDTIRKITPAGAVSTLAGSAGFRGSADATGSAARFNFPEGLAVDGSGNIYVADGDNQTIRKVTPGGVVTTIAGTALSKGGADGVGSTARFFEPAGLTITTDGTLYLADRGNNAIRKIKGGNVTTLAGAPGAASSVDGVGTAARFDTPTEVAVDGAGNAYVADSVNHTIRKIAPDKRVTTLAGAAGKFGSNDGTGSAALFNAPTGVAVDSSGTVYVADAGNNAIRKITPAGTVTTLAGSPGTSGSANGTGAAALFNRPSGVAVEGAGNVYVADTYNNLIRKVTPAGVVTTLAGTAGSFGSADGTGAAARFSLPGAIAIDSSGTLYVADTANSTVRKITPAGAVTTVAGSAGSGGSDDGTRGAARFDNPQGIAATGAGVLFVADTGNSTIRKITAAGLVTTLAGSPGKDGSQDGTGSAALFNSPQGIAVRAAGLVYVADTGSNTVRIGGPTAVSQLLNIATRLQVQTGNNVLIGGFIVIGSAPKTIILRAIGPSLTARGVPGALADPVLELRDSGGNLVMSNDNWKINDENRQSQQAAINAIGIAPSNDKESVILVTLPPNQGYTATLSGKGDTTGVAVVEAYDLNASDDALLANISTRGVVGTDANAMIAGVIVGGGGQGKVLLRAIGPSLAAAGIEGVLADPQLRLVNSNGVTVQENDNWRSNQEAALAATGIAPTDNRESAILATVPPDSYTAIVRGVNDTTGVAVVEVYNLN